MNLDLFYGHLCPVYKQKVNQDIKLIRKGVHIDNKMIYTS